MPGAAPSPESSVVPGACEGVVVAAASVVIGRDCTIQILPSAITHSMSCGLP